MVICNQKGCTRYSHEYAGCNLNECYLITKERRKRKNDKREARIP